MVTDIAIWNAPASLTRYGGRGLAAAHADVTGHSAGDAYTEADYIPAGTYLNATRAIVPGNAASAEIVPVSQPSFMDSGRGRSGVQLYASIFNYRYPPAERLSIRV